MERVTEQLRLPCHFKKYQNVADVGVMVFSLASDLSFPKFLEKWYSSDKPVNKQIH